MLESKDYSFFSSNWNWMDNFIYFFFLFRCPCAIVVDSGYSSTHIVPFMEDKIISEGVKR